MPVLNRLKFRKRVNEALLVRDKANSRSIAAEHEFKRAEHHVNSLPALKGTMEERMHAASIREGKQRQLRKLEMNALGEAVDLSVANKKFNLAKNSRKKAPVAGLRIGQAIANIFLGSNKVTSVTKKMGRVFSVAKKTEKKKPLVTTSRYAQRLTPKRENPPTRGPIRGRFPRA